MRSLSLLALLTACSPVETRTAILLELSADDPAEIQSLTDTLWVVLDPEEPYTDAYGEPYEAGEYGSTGVFANVITDDEDLEFVIEVDPGEGCTLPVVELKPGNNGDKAFSVSVLGYLGSAWTVGSETKGPLSFEADRPVSHGLKLSPLDVPITLCNNGLDDDEDGWIDAADPDWASGDEERGGVRAQ